MPLAAIVHKEGLYEDVKFEERPALKPSKGCVVVDVLSAGLAFPDILTVGGKHISKPPTPFVVGAEVCGRITAVGEGVKDWKLGDTVFGTSATGGIAEEAELFAKGIYQLPLGVNPTVAAGFELNYGTTWHGIVDLGGLQAGETLLVLGASGGVGAAAIDIGKAHGATVVACASSEEKLAFCESAGADHLINYEKDDLRTELKKMKLDGRIDMVYDPVGGRWAEPAMRSLGWAGRYLVIGFAAGGETPKDAIPKLPLNLALLNERKILGVFWGAWKDQDKNQGNKKNIHTMMEMVRDGKLKPEVSKVYEMETSSFHEACKVIMGRQVLGKVCLQPVKVASRL